MLNSHALLITKLAKTLLKTDSNSLITKSATECSTQIMKHIKLNVKTCSSRILFEKIQADQLLHPMRYGTHFCLTIQDSK